MRFSGPPARRPGLPGPHSVARSHDVIRRLLEWPHGRSAHSPPPLPVPPTLEFLSEHPRVFVPLPTAVHSTGSLSRRIRMLPQRQTSRLSVQSAIFIAAITAFPLIGVFAAGAPEVTNNANTEVRDAAAVAILSGRVTDDAGKPLADVRVRVAIPATDM